jgi:YaiO family outer membrane protein
MAGQWALALHRMRSRSSSEPLREHPTAPWNACHTRFNTALVTLAVLLPALAFAAPTATAQTPAPEATELRRQAERLRREQRLPEALAAYRAVVALEPESFEDRFWVAKLESWTGGLEAADSAFVRLVAERPDDYDSRIALADVRRWRGETAAARELLEDLRRTHPDDPEVLQRLDALRRVAPRTRWEADVEYFGERLPSGSTANGGTLSLRASPGEWLRWRAAATLQEKFDRTESRAGGELGFRVTRSFEVTGSAFLAPGAEVLPRQSYGLGLSHKIGRRLVLHTDYAFLDYRDAQVHQAGPGLELYAGHWLFTGRYRYAATRFAGTAASVDDHAGSLAVGFLYGPSNLVRIFAAAGGESFTQPSRDLIGRFDAHTVGVAWRHFLTPGFGVEALYAHQDRSDGGDQDSYSLRVLRRW